MHTCVCACVYVCKCVSVFASPSHTIQPNEMFLSCESRFYRDFIQDFELGRGDACMCVCV